MTSPNAKQQPQKKTQLQTNPQRNPDRPTEKSILSQTNAWLKVFGLAPAASRTQARKAVKHIHINIYDLKAGQLDKTFRTRRELRKYTRKHKLYYPLWRIQKQEQELRLFIEKFF